MPLAFTQEDFLVHDVSIKTNVVICHFKEKKLKRSGQLFLKPYYESACLNFISHCGFEVK